MSELLLEKDIHSTDEVGLNHLSESMKRALKSIADGDKVIELEFEGSIIKWDFTIGEWYMVG